MIPREEGELEGRHREKRMLLKHYLEQGISIAAMGAWLGIGRRTIHYCRNNLRLFGQNALISPAGSEDAPCL